MTKRLLNGNLQKYQNRNFVQRLLIRRFQNAVVEAVRDTAAQSMLDAGSGEGFTAEILRQKISGISIVCTDTDVEAIGRGCRLFPALTFRKEDILSLSIPDKSFDIVMCLEVLEHLQNPCDALKEFRRVTRKYVLVSTPHEPWFRIANMLRGKNLKAFGNDPEHIQHWNPTTLKEILNTNGYTVLKCRLRFPWMLFLCEVKR